MIAENVPFAFELHISDSMHIYNSIHFKVQIWYVVGVTRQFLANYI